MFSFLASLVPCINPVKGFDDDNPLPVASCTFCHVSKKNGFQMVWEDDTFFAFKDHKPAADHHVLIIPKWHVPSVRSLRRSDTTLVQSMEKLGHKLLDDLSVSASARRMGFHIPPFNSVNHLHLHVHGLPYKSAIREAKYMIAEGSNGYEKGYSWFAEVGQVIRILSKDRRVEVFPC